MADNVQQPLPSKRQLTADEKTERYVESRVSKFPVCYWFDESSIEPILIRMYACAERILIKYGATRVHSYDKLTELPVPARKQLLLSGVLDGGSVTHIKQLGLGYIFQQNCEYVAHGFQFCYPGAQSDLTEAKKIVQSIITEIDDAIDGEFNDRQIPGTNHNLFYMHTVLSSTVHTDLHDEGLVPIGLLVTFCLLPNS